MFVSGLRPVSGSYEDSLPQLSLVTVNPEATHFKIVELPVAWVSQSGEKPLTLISVSTHQYAMALKNEHEP